jgi:hypothetical protein
MTVSDYYMSVTDTAKLVRAALKKAFPGVKFSVRSSSYSMGASIDVSWEDGPRKADVDQIIKAYSGSDFDGMIDLKTSNSHWLYPDGHTAPAVSQIGHSYGSTAHDIYGNEVAREDVADYSLGIRHGSGVTNTIEPRSRDAEPFRRGLRDGQKLVSEGVRLVHFGADYVMSQRGLSEGYREELEHAVLVLSGVSGPFDNNKRYSFGILAEGEDAGRAFEDYGSTLVYQLSEHDPAHLAGAVRRWEDRWIAERERTAPIRIPVVAAHQPVSDECRLGERFITCACGHVAQGSVYGDAASRNHEAHVEQTVGQAIEAYDAGGVDWAGRNFGQLSPDEKQRAAKAATDQLAAELTAAAPEITRIMDECCDECGLPVDLGLASNYHGKLSADVRARLEAVVADPSNETWDDAHSIILNADNWPGLGLTLWQAVIAVDPTFPRVGPRLAEDSRNISQWERIPTAETIRQAINYATR